MAAGAGSGAVGTPTGEVGPSGEGARDVAGPVGPEVAADVGRGFVVVTVVGAGPVDDGAGDPVCAGPLDEPGRVGSVRGCGGMNTDPTLVPESSDVETG